MIVMTPFYTGLLALLYVLLSCNVIFNRLRYKQSLGVGKEHKLEKAVRAHANFAEYVPLVIIMMAFLEWGKESSSLLHFLGVTLIVGRMAHAVGIGMNKAPNNFRMLGILATFTCLIGASLKLIVMSLNSGF